MKQKMRKSEPVIKYDREKILISTYLLKKKY